MRANNEEHISHGLRHSLFVILKMFAELNLELSLKLKLLCEFRILKLKLLCEFLIPLIEEALERLSLCNHVLSKLLNMFKLRIMAPNAQLHFLKLFQVFLLLLFQYHYLPLQLIMT